MYKVEDITKINGEVFNSNNVKYFEPKDFFIVPNELEEQFSNELSDRVYFTHNELLICFGKKPSKEDLDALLYVKKIFYPSTLVRPQRKPTHLH